MKVGLILITTTLLAMGTGCETAEPISTQAALDERYPNQEPYSKEQIETIEERAGAQTQSREGIEENPFLEPKEENRRREQGLLLP
jgi:hypothetical protein